MKYVLIFFIAGLLTFNVRLALLQKKLEHKIHTMEQAQAEMAAEESNRPTVSPELLLDTQARVEKAQTAIEAAEKRLTNATSVLNAVETAMKSPQNPAATTRMLGGRSRRPGVDSSLDSTAQSLVTGYEPVFQTTALMPASSHGPDGQPLQRNWGPEQVLGPPNTDHAGDIPTAWAPRNSSYSGEEWLHVNYDQPVDISTVNVRETYNPGAISKITAVMANGQETTIWEGAEPQSQAPVDMQFPAPAGIQANSVKIYLDRRRVPGWNEIDAVELVGRDGTRQWAKSAVASSSFASQ